jgi:hypothetical protein
MNPQYFAGRKFAKERSYAQGGKTQLLVVADAALGVPELRVLVSRRPINLLGH